MSLIGKSNCHEFTAQHAGADYDETTESTTVWMHAEGWTEKSLESLMLMGGSDSEGGNSGIESVYLELPIQRYAIYGGITEAHLQRSCLRLRLDEHASSHFGGFSKIIVHLEIAQPDFEKVRDGLRYIFADCTCFKESDETAS